jgi:hypothetical protein
MTDLQTLSNTLVGAVSPIITQLLRMHVIKCDDRAAHWLSIAVAAGCVAASFFVTKTPFVLQDFGADASMAFLLSQVVYHNIMHDDGDEKPDAGAP